jgi:hypothetical protein
MNQRASRPAGRWARVELNHRASCRAISRAEPPCSASLAYIRTRCLSAVTTTGYVRTRCINARLHIACLHLYVLLVCRHYRWLGSFALYKCTATYRRPTFVRVAPSTLIPLAGPLLECTADLLLYALRNRSVTHHVPAFVRAARLPLSSYTLHKCTVTHRRPTFVCAAPSALIFLAGLPLKRTADLCSYAW